jgi:hypothetical protein
MIKALFDVEIFFSNLIAKHERQDVHLLCGSLLHILLKEVRAAALRKDSRLISWFHIFFFVHTVLFHFLITLSLIDKSPTVIPFCQL